MSRHFLTLNDLTAIELQSLIMRACELKKEFQQKRMQQTRPGRVLAMIFEKSSTRTRVSFETGMSQLGGHAMFLSPKDIQLGRGEPIEDSARVISSMVDGIMIRTFGHDRLMTIARHSNRPVINGLTDYLHPCQLLADMQTWFELRGDIEGATVAWIGDGNNMCHSYINAAIRLNFKLNIGCPKQHIPDTDTVKNAGDRVKIFNSASEAASNADLVVTDVWASMGQEQEQQDRLNTFSEFQVSSEIMALADRDALFMHCLPAHRGEEVSAAVLDGEQSVIWQEAENRLHAQKSLLETLLI